MIYGQTPYQRKELACKYLFKCGARGTSCQERHISQRKATARDHLETKANSVQKHTDKIRNGSVINCRQNTTPFPRSQIKMASGWNYKLERKRLTSGQRDGSLNSIHRSGHQKEAIFGVPLRTPEHPVYTQSVNNKKQSHCDQQPMASYSLLQVHRHSRELIAQLWV